MIMAANPKQLRVIDAHLDAPCTRVLEIECVEGGAFDVVGGKYIIVHTGLVFDGKAVKRAYSLMPVPGRPGRATIAVKRLPGLGSQAMHDLPIDARLGFSGPWGKLVPEAGLARRTLLVATDTGITSALGIVEQRAISGEPCTLAVVWLRETAETFFSVAQVRQRIERAGAACSTHDIAPLGSSLRAAQASELVEAHARRFEASHVIATGDGAIVYPLRESLSLRVPQVVDVRIECFFNNPEKKSA
jgi:ferredoxin-NADP reductase